MPQYTKQQVIQALQQSKGMVYVAARQLGCTPQTIYNHMKRSPDVQSAIEDARGEAVDVAELKLMQAINKGEAWAIALMLKTQGKDRGYTERLELEHQYVVIVKQIQEAARNAGLDPAEALNDYYAELSAIGSAAGNRADTSESP